MYVRKADRRMKPSLIAVFLLTLCACAAKQETQRFDPVEQDAVTLFGVVCMGLYPLNDGSLERWLDQPGVEKLERADRSGFSTLSSTEYLVQGAALYSVVYEKINLCTVQAMGLQQESLEFQLGQLRKGLKNEGMQETLEVKDTRSALHKHYRYTQEGSYVMRIDHSFNADGLASLSTVSELRSQNIK